MKPLSSVVILWIFCIWNSFPTGSFDTHTQEEQALITPDQKSHTVVWYHAPFANNDTGISRISIGLDITERKAAEARLVWLAERDPLTELYNRRYFQDALQKLFGCRIKAPFYHWI
ncbi:hypothetical protein HSBAA_45320 [Vreelandella sulfidaeris]|uniref:Uncharacterized protein n=1 Tax=Vreelandella sulfidaeris TaxID=115553 RepID=A0A455UAK0_9GAMM|nr:hypothetical protein HSBAA_45320 [Halomonas sulfidaeris]